MLYGVTRRIRNKIVILISTRDTVFGWVQAPPQLSRKVPSFIWYIFCWGPKLVLGVTNEKPKTRICARSFAWTFRFTQVKFLSCCDGFEKNKFQGFWQYIYICWYSQKLLHGETFSRRKSRCYLLLFVCLPWGIYSFLIIFGFTQRAATFNTPKYSKKSRK